MEKLNKITILIALLISVFFSCRNKTKLVVHQLSIDERLFSCLSADLDFYKNNYMTNNIDSVFILYVENEKSNVLLEFYPVGDIKGIFPEVDYYGYFYCNEILILYAINGREEFISPLFKVNKKTISLIENPLPKTKDNLSNIDYLYDPYYIEYNFRNGRIYDGNGNVCKVISLKKQVKNR